MNSSTLLLANFGDVWAKNLGISTSSLEIICILGALLLVISALVIWVVYFRKRQGNRKRRHHAEERSRSAMESTGSGDEGKERSRRRRRRERTRNPSLAEKGGLPPLRPEEPSVNPSELS